MAELIYTYDNPPNPRDIARAVDVLKRDGVISYPTEVNWAIGCDATSPKALEKIRKLKPHHPKDRPFALICKDVSMAADIVQIDNQAYRYLKKAFPGPFTVFLPSLRNLPKQIKDKRRVVGVRVPDCPLLWSIIEELGQPLATTSVPELADTGMTPKFGYEVEELIGHGLDLILDLGQELPATETTIVDFTLGYPELIREGAGDPGIFDL